MTKGKRRKDEYEEDTKCDVNGLCKYWASGDAIMVHGSTVVLPVRMTRMRHNVTSDSASPSEARDRNEQDDVDPALKARHDERISQAQEAPVEGL
jgi:hypothetical protein